MPSGTANNQRLLAALTVAGFVASLFVLFARRRRHTEEADDATKSAAASVRVAFLGNSMLYYNDCPRFLSHMSNGRIARQDSCLRGGSDLASLWNDGNGMADKFRTPHALRGDGTYDVGSPTVRALLGDMWDFCVMNDHTQHPARGGTRNETIGALREEYAPLLEGSGAVPIFVMTPAYRRLGIKESEDLGDHEEFLAKLKRGYEAYADALGEILPREQRPRVAPVGEAFEYLRKNDEELWEGLFHTDDFHPSPLGTYLQGCVLHWTMFTKAPDKQGALGEDNLWEENLVRLWGDARVMQPEGEPAPRMPTREEAVKLMSAAEAVCKGRVKEEKRKGG